MEALNELKMSAHMDVIWHAMKKGYLLYAVAYVDILDYAISCYNKSKMINIVEALFVLLCVGIYATVYWEYGK